MPRVTNLQVSPQNNPSKKIKAPWANTQSKSSKEIKVRAMPN
jgi:hypothetical protein